MARVQIYFAEAVGDVEGFVVRLRSTLFAALFFAGQLVVQLNAAPTLNVSHLGLNSVGNRQWVVSVAPDPGLFTSTPQGEGGVLSVEFALEISGAELLTATKNAVDWPLNTPGQNPFTGAVSVGVAVDLADETAFAALTSRFLTTGQAITLLQVETAGAGAATFAWGGHQLLVGTPFQYAGSRISQAGANFDAYQGSVVIPAASADFNGDDVVDGDDFLAWQRGLRTDGLANRADGDADSDGMVDGADLQVWKSQFGGPGLQDLSTENISVLPEPRRLWLAMVGSLAWLRRLRPNGYSLARAVVAP